MHRRIVREVPVRRKSFGTGKLATGVRPMWVDLILLAARHHASHNPEGHRTHRLRACMIVRRAESVFIEGLFHHAT